MDSKEVLKQLLRDGFVIVSIKGSHQKLRKGDKTVVLPHPKKDLPLGTVNSIRRQAGWRK